MNKELLKTSLKEACYVMIPILSVLVWMGLLYLFLSLNNVALLVTYILVSSFLICFCICYKAEKEEQECKKQKEERIQTIKNKYTRKPKRRYNTLY